MKNEDIEQSLTRLLELDYDNYEVIAVNDRSTDRTGEIMESVARLASRKTREMGHRSARDSSPRIARGLAGQNSCDVDCDE